MKTKVSIKEVGLLAEALGGFKESMFFAKRSFIEYERQTKQKHKDHSLNKTIRCSTLRNFPSKHITIMIA